MEYFPTPAYKRSILVIRSVLSNEKARLDTIAEKKGRSCALGEDNLESELPHILEFCAAYQNAFMKYLAAVLPQHTAGVQCKAGCGNCCHHFPMSVEPFELVEFYETIRKSPDLLSLLEDCHFRTKTYYALLQKGVDMGAEDPEDYALVNYFNKSLACPFVLPSGSCGVYPTRPVTCRMYFSETPGEFCVPEHLLTERNRSFIVYLPDEIEEQIADVSAHYADLSLPEGLYEGVLALNAFESSFANAEKASGDFK